MRLIRNIDYFFNNHFFTIELPLINMGMFMLYFKQNLLNYFNCIEGEKFTQ